VILPVPISPPEIAAAAKRRQRLHHIRRCPRCGCWIAMDNRSVECSPCDLERKRRAKGTGRVAADLDTRTSRRRTVLKSVVPRKPPFEDSPGLRDDLRPKPASPRGGDLRRGLERGSGEQRQEDGAEIHIRQPSGR
jgi:hypothetical protein